MGMFTCAHCDPEWANAPYVPSEQVLAAQAAEKLRLEVLARPRLVVFPRETAGFQAARLGVEDWVSAVHTDACCGVR